MNLILVSGVMRSGSTWAFNVCRSLGASAARIMGVPVGSDYLESEALDAVIEQCTAPAVLVIKSHHTLAVMRSYVAGGHAKNVSTIRDPRDCVASRQLFKDESFESSIALVKGSFHDARCYGPGTLRVLYPDIMADPHTVVKAIAEHLLLNITGAHAAAIVAEFSLDNMRRRSDTLSTATGAVDAHGGLLDPATALHSDHIHGGTVGRWEAELTKAQRKQVHRELDEEIEWYEELHNKRG